MVNLLLLTIFLVIFVVLAWTFWRALRDPSAGSLWEKMLAAGRGSASILWARFVMALGALFGALANYADLAQLPAIQDLMRVLLTPQTFGIAVALISLVSEIARRRTLDQ